jgi:transposase-like protein
MKKFSKEEKAMWLEDWQRSGKSAWPYARENGLNPQTFVNWTKPKKKIKHPFVEVPRRMLQSSYQGQEILIEKGELKIHIPLEPVLAEFKNAIAKLGQAI